MSYDGLNDAEKNRKTRRIFLRWILSFFLLFITVDMVFYYLASRTHTGVVTEQAYDKGLAYNETVAAADSQELLGWQVEIALVDDLLTVTALDRDGAGLEGAVITADLTRPTMQGYDFSFGLEPQGDGVYSNRLNAPLDGQWDARVFISHQGKKYQKSKRIQVSK